jgi:polyisoprenoid-binding protein YceI
MSTTETSVIAPVGTWNLDPVHSIVGFEVDYLAGTFKGSFKDVTATLTIAEDGTATLEGAADVTSVDVRDEDQNAHIQGPEFFDAESFPQLLFTAEDVKLDGEQAIVNGQITIKGVTKPVALTGTVVRPIEDPWGNQRLGVTLTATVDRTEFGLDWNTPLPGGDLALANDVKIVAELQFVKSA